MIMSSSETSPELKFALGLLSSIGELRRDAVVAGLQAQLEEARRGRAALESELAAATRRCRAAKQAVEDLTIENEWLHSFYGGATGDADAEVDNRKKLQQQADAGKKKTGASKAKRPSTSSSSLKGAAARKGKKAGGGVQKKRKKAGAVGKLGDKRNKSAKK